MINGETIATADTGMQAVKCIDGKIYFIQDGTLMRYDGGGDTRFANRMWFILRRI